MFSFFRKKSSKNNKCEVSTPATRAVDKSDTICSIVDGGAASPGGRSAAAGAESPGGLSAFRNAEPSSPHHNNLIPNINKQPTNGATFRNNESVQVQTNQRKDVVNLLLPAERINYKKEDSYSVKNSVQSLLDIMGGRKNRSFKNNKKAAPANRAWSFQTPSDLKRRVDSTEDDSETKKSKTCGEGKENDKNAWTPANVTADISVKDVTSTENWKTASAEEEKQGDIETSLQSEKNCKICDTLPPQIVSESLDEIQRTSHECGGEESQMGASDSKQDAVNRKYATSSNSQVKRAETNQVFAKSNGFLQVECKGVESEMKPQPVATEETEIKEDSPITIANGSFKLSSPKPILKDLSPVGDRESTKKRVTFDSVIAFDDGDKVDDVVEDDSLLESFSSSEDDVQVSSEDENNDEMPHDGDVTIIRERENFGKQTPAKNEYQVDDSSFPEVFNPATKSQNSGIVELEVENNENLGTEDATNEYTVEFESEDDSTGSLKIEKLRNQPFNSIVEIKDDSQESKEEDTSASEDILEESLEEKEESLESEILEEEHAVLEEEEIEEPEEEDDSSQYESDIDEMCEEIEEDDDDSDDEEDEEEEVEEEESVESENSSDLCVKDTKIICDSENKQTMDRQVYNGDQELENQLMLLEQGQQDSAYADLLRVIHRQMRGVLGQETKLADLQERAAALHRVQSEVCNARKEAELVRQKLKCVEFDLSATRSRNAVILEEFETKTAEAKEVGERAAQLEQLANRLQSKLDEITPEHSTLKAMNTKLQQQLTSNEEIWAKESSAKERAWRAQFERLRSQGAEREEMLLADCEWKLRDVQKQAHEKCQAAEDRLKEAQRQADFRSHQADLAVQQARSEAREQVQILQQKTAHLKSLLETERATIATMKTQHTKELEDKEMRLSVQLEEQSRRLKNEQREHVCEKHEKIIKEAHEKLEHIKTTLARKEAQFEDSLEKAKSRADWEVLEMRRMLDKADIQYASSIERLQEEHENEREKITAESERRIKELEASLSATTCSARATLELVRGQLRAEHAEAILRLKEAHKLEMDRQWEMFTTDKEQCLERMKAECILEGQEERDKRNKQLTKDIQDLKLELAAKENELSSMRVDTRKANDAKVTAEKKLSETQALCVAREGAARAEAARQAETAQREAKETIDHLTKKCACLSNLFEDMRSRWQQAPGESAQLRKALQDERARTAALRRQLEAISRGRRRECEEGETSSSSSPGNPGPSTEFKNPFEEWTVVRQKRKNKRITISPIKYVDLPAVTVPVRIKHYNSLRKTQE